MKTQAVLTIQVIASSGPGDEGLVVSGQSGIEGEIGERGAYVMVIHALLDAAAIARTVLQKYFDEKGEQVPPFGKGSVN